MFTEESPSGAVSPQEEAFDRWRKRVGGLLGPALFLWCLVRPWVPSEPQQNSLLAVLLWVLVWWLTEPIPLPVTALWGPTLAVILGVDTPGKLFAPFADPVIFLFLGSFMLAQATVEAGLDRRLALWVLSWRWVGGSRRRILFIFGLVVAMLSLWLSNTATTAMMYPLALAIAGATSDGPSRYVTALLLATAYASSIGGVGTPVGTPPNLIALGQLQALAGVKVSFLAWMAVGLPVATLVLLFSLWYLSRLGAMGTSAMALAPLRQKRKRLGPLTRREKNVLFAFCLAVSLWLAPSLVSLATSPQEPLASSLAHRLPESVVALLAAMLLFILPVDQARSAFTLNWAQAMRIDWGTLLLFGGGLSLGGQLFQSGLAEKLGQFLIRTTGASTSISLAYLFAFLAIMLTETTSNTAAATVTCPLAIAASKAAAINPVAPTIAAAIATSFAFMLPVSTPPNAIVYGSGLIRVTQMVRAGLTLDVLALVTVPPLVVFLCNLWGLG